MNEHDPITSSVYLGDAGTPPPPPSSDEQSTLEAPITVVVPPRRKWFGLPIVGSVFILVTAVFLIGVVTVYGIIQSHTHLFFIAPASTSTPNPQAVQTMIALQTAQTVTPAASHATPTATVIPSPTAIPLALAFTCPRNQPYKNAQVCVHTVPNAQLTITVTDCDGQRDFSPPLLLPVQADNAGNYTWKWRPRHAQECTLAPQNTATAEVTATSAGQTTTSSLTLIFH